MRERQKLDQFRWSAVTQADQRKLADATPADRGDGRKQKNDAAMWRDAENSLLAAEQGAPRAEAAGIHCLSGESPDGKMTVIWKSMPGPAAPKARDWGPSMLLRMYMRWAEPSTANKAATDRGKKGEGEGGRGNQVHHP